MSWSTNMKDFIKMMEEQCIAKEVKGTSTFYMLKDFQPRVNGKPTGSPVSNVIAITEGKVTWLKDGKRVNKHFDDIATSANIYLPYKDIKNLDPKLVAHIVERERRNNQAFSIVGKNGKPTEYQFHMSPHGGKKANVLFLTIKYEGNGKEVHIMYEYENIMQTYKNRQPAKPNTPAIKEMFIEVEMEHTVTGGPNKGNTYTMKHILCSYFKVDKRNQHADPDKLVELYIKNISKERIEKYVKQDTLGGKMISYEFVYKKNGKFVKGEYYAHEYDEYLEAKARKLTWSSGTIEFEVKVLEPGYVTIAGVWDDSGIGYSRLSSGTGDHFTPYGKGLL